MRKGKKQKKEIAGEKRLLSIQEAAVYLGISPWTVRDFISKGFLPFIQFPSSDRPQLKRFRRYLLDKADLDLFIEQYRVPSSVNKGKQ